VWLDAAERAVLFLDDGEHRMQVAERRLGDRRRYFLLGRIEISVTLIIDLAAAQPGNGDLVIAAVEKRSLEDFIATIFGRNRWGPPPAAGGLIVIGKCGHRFDVMVQIERAHDEAEPYCPSCGRAVVFSSLQLPNEAAPGGRGRRLVEASAAAPMAVNFAAKANLVLGEDPDQVDSIVEFSEFATLVEGDREERGIVRIVCDIESRRSRLIMRSSDAQHVILNHYIVPGLLLKTSVTSVSYHTSDYAIAGNVRRLLVRLSFEGREVVNYFAVKFEAAMTCNATLMAASQSRVTPAGMRECSNRTPRLPMLMYFSRGTGGMSSGHRIPALRSVNRLKDRQRCGWLCQTPRRWCTRIGQIESALRIGR
jgi:hypothetical protein